MSDLSRREFIHKTYWECLGLAGAGGLLSFACGSAGTAKVDTKTGATKVLFRMPSIDNLPEIHDIDERRILARRDNPVAVVKSSNAEEAAYEVLNLLKPELRADRVFIKANYSTYPFVDMGVKPKKKEHYYMGTTQPEFVYGIMHYLHDRGIPYQNMTMGEGIGKSTSDRFSYMGYFERSKKMGFRVLDITKDDIAGYRMKHAGLLTETGCSKVFSDHLQDGVVISAPKMKVHHFATLTLSLKNMMGIILPFDKKYIMHAELTPMWAQTKERKREDYFKTVWSFSKRLIDLYSLAPDFSVVDGVTGGEGHGVANEYKGEQVTFPVESHRAFASTNSINLDTVCGHFMGHNPMHPGFSSLPEMKFIPWLYLAQKRKYGYMYLKRIPILGDEKLIEPEYTFRLLPEIDYVKFQERKG